jgi:hypothetical protein
MLDHERRRAKLAVGQLRMLVNVARQVMTCCSNCPANASAVGQAGD